MVWGRIDDKLHGNVKWLRTPPRARGLWITALSWCCDQGNGGAVPADMVRRFDGSKADAEALVRTGLWKHAGDGYVFHDWSIYQPDAESLAAKRSAEAEGGRRGNHLRWHVKRRVKVAGCEWCESGGDQVPESPPNPPDPARPDPKNSGPSGMHSTTSSVPREEAS